MAAPRAPSFTLSIPVIPADFGGGNPEGARQQLKLVLGKVAEQIGDGVSVGGDIADPNGADRPAIGTWAYTVPQPPEPEK